MIASIKGQLAHKSATNIVIDVNGIGYLVFVPLSTFYVLPEKGDPVCLHIYTHVKEDALQLYGFHTEEEKKIFQLMISVSGIGPRLAINILSGISAGDLADALSAGNLGKLTNIPGIGKKMAERLVFELKDKVPRLAEKGNAAEPGQGIVADESVAEDALSALVNLGYKSSTARQMLDKIVREGPGNLSLEELLKKTLKILGN